MRACLWLFLLGLCACQRREQTALDRLHPCTLAEGPTDGYCGKLAVFEDREARRGRKIDLKIVVLPALSRDPKPDPIFFFQGGPGAAAATLASTEAPIFKRFQTDRDIVLVDQRGTGGSNSLACDYAEQIDEDYENINNYPVDKVRACLEKLKQKADPALYTTPIAMDDIDEVRRTLGYGQINLWGISYGTRAALIYLKRHEDAVRAVVLDSVDAPEMKFPLYMARDGQRALDRLLADCAKDAACEKEFPDLKRVVDELFARLRAKPRVRIAHPMTGKVVEFPVGDQLVAGVVYATLYNPAAASLLPRLLWDATRGNYQGILANGLGARPEPGSVSEGMFLSVICSEDFPRISAEEVKRETGGRFFGTTMFDSRVKPCAFWPKGKITPDYYEPVRSSKPVLVLSGADDPITPPSWGEQVAKELKNAVHILAPGLGHGVSPHGCAPDLIGRLFDTASVAGLDGGCLNVQHRPPFFVNYTGPVVGAPAEKKP